jgi:hypothetical protein
MKVPFDIETLSKCICYNCPVQASSPCTKNGRDIGLKIKEAPASSELRKKIPQPKSLAGIYCSSGESPCKDLQFDKICTCPVCENFITYKLRQNNKDYIEGYFCGQGAAP